MNEDLPGMVWRGSTTSYFIVDQGAATRPYDTVALIGTNLRATDTVLIRTGATPTGVGGYSGSAVAAWTGEKPEDRTATSIIKLGSTRTERYLRIDFAAPSHPDSHVEIVRLVVGKMIKTVGIDYDAEVGFEDSSIITVGPGYRSVDRYDVVTSLKFSTGWISEVSWRSDWYPLLQWAGASRAILVVPDDTTPEYWQTDALFGCITSKATGKAQGYNAWRFEATITALST